MSCSSYIKFKIIAAHVFQNCPSYYSQFWNITCGIYAEYHVQTMLLPTQIWSGFEAMQRQVFARNAK